MFIARKNRSLDWSDATRAAYFDTLYFYTYFVLFKLGLQVLTFIVNPPDALVAALAEHLRSVKKAGCEKFGLFWPVENIYDFFKKVGFPSIGSEVVSEDKVSF